MEALVVLLPRPDPAFTVNLDSLVIGTPRRPSFERSSQCIPLTYFSLQLRKPLACS